MARLEIEIRLRLGDFDLRIDEAAELTGVTALLGPSGSGKSTLLRIIAGLERRASGHIHYAGEAWQQPTRHLPAWRRGATLLFQDVRLFPHLNVAGNLAYAAKRANPERPGPDQAEVVGALELEDQLERQAQSLSGGEAQRVAIGRALLARPRLLLMDEPLAALDLDRRARLLDQIAGLPARFGIPVLYVTHAIEEVARVADRTILMSHGRWTAQDETSVILERLDLPDFTGGGATGALLRATVAGQIPEFALTRLSIGSQQISVPAVTQAVGSEVRLRVRARDVALATRRPESTSIRNVLEARILSVDTENDSAYAEVLLDMDGHHLRARVTRASASELGLITGQPVFALVKSIALDGRPIAGEV
jgi:molybdate transport system ATP-binding protein